MSKGLIDTKSVEKTKDKEAEQREKEAMEKFKAARDKEKEHMKVPFLFLSFQ